MNAINLTASTINSLQNEYETIANNLSNVSTDGFKRTVNDFSRSLSSSTASQNAVTGGKISDHTNLDFSQGTLVPTGRNLDLALSSTGFFVLETKTGPVYTRNGNFKLNPQGQLADIDGNLVSGEFGPITVPSQVPISELQISQDGNVRHGELLFGKIKVVDFEDISAVTPLGKGNYAVDEDLRPRKVSEPIIRQGYKEGSNVNMMEELVALITVTRMYEANMKILSKQSEDNSQILNVAMG